MQRIKSFDSPKATLYIVATPIGNLNDISLRAVNTLKSVVRIYAEDTRTSGTLLKHYEIKTPMQSYHEHNEHEKTEQALEHLRKGESIALISDAGTPRISDPGDPLIASVRDHGFAVSPIPGASAVLSALMMARMRTDMFTFVGFLPAKTTAREKMLHTLAVVNHTLVFYETPHRITKTLASMYSVFGEREATLVREVTKQHEEAIDFLLSEHGELDNLRGEMVIVVSGDDTQAPIDALDVLSHIELLLEDGASEKDAIKRAASARGMKKNDVYMQYQTHKKRMQSKE